MQPTIRPATREDIPAMKSVVDSCELFPSEYLEEMMDDFLNNQNSEEFWFTKTENEIPVGIGYCVPEKFTDGTFNLLAIGVKKETQGKGVGAQLMNYIEHHLRELGARILIVETSSAEHFGPTRNFYNKIGYTQEAVIRDFWTEGDDKVIFWKKL